MKVTRSELRERIMTCLYQINIYRKDNMEYTLEDVLKENDKENNKFVKDIVTTTADQLIADSGIEMTYLVGTMIEVPRAALIKRLGNIDQAIFRMSVYELLYTKTPHVVSINEGIVLSKKYSDEKVTSMLNAVLDKILNNEVKDE